MLKGKSLEIGKIICSCNKYFLINKKMYKISTPRNKEFHTRIFKKRKKNYFKLNPVKAQK